MFNPIDISKSWLKSFNPTTEEQQLANERTVVCLSCPSRVEDIGFVNLLISKDNILEGWKCGECECPLSKKVYSQFGCPLDKW